MTTIMLAARLARRHATGGLIGFAANQAAAAAAGRWRHPTPVNVRRLGHVRRDSRRLAAGSHALGRCLSTSRAAASGSILLGRHVKEALANGQPVVALESTVITHGLPEPRNLELALGLEAEIFSGRWWRDERTLAGCENDTPTTSMRGQVVPATVGVVLGQLIVGLSREQIEFLANRALSGPVKASRRDLALVQAARLSAGTTVSATMALASGAQAAATTSSGSPLAAIGVFATGGLGGVHLGGESSLDISADLYEMARSPIGLVSAGFKSFLDARRSLEVLETLGCTVASLRPTAGVYQAAATAAEQPFNEATGDFQEAARRGHLFPGFFTQTNAQQAQSPWQCASVPEAARLLLHCLATGPPGHSGGFLGNARALLLACPIPSEFSLRDDGEEAQMMAAVTSQVERRTDLSGAQKTPLILAELARLTRGRTLEANLALLRNNARIGAHLAHEYARLRAGE